MNNNPEHDFKAIAAAATQHGLIPRGGFAVEADDDVPDIPAPGGRMAAKYLLLFGNAGSAMWDVFGHAVEYHDHRPDPLNRWSTRIGHALADEFSAQAFFPFGTPHRPFLRWGKKAEALRNSHLGMLIHPQFGLWHAYRFALAFPAAPAQTESPAATAGGDICRRCAPKPCRPACPVNAFTEAGYDAQSCYRYLASHPDSKCMTAGCQARVACPHGSGYRYEAHHAAFHMRAFVAAMAAKEFPEAAWKGSPPRVPAPRTT